MLECFDGFKAFASNYGLPLICISKLIMREKSLFELLEILVGCNFTAGLECLYLLAGSKIEDNVITNIGEHNTL